MSLLNNALSVETVGFHALRPGERVVAMKQNGDHVFVLTNQVVYEMIDGALTPIDLAQPVEGTA